ncbi:hypothetical protein L596_025620 [Steinernema carpocapsae]|uniref:Uncharacterized protein n=1 Tax=Steinernema carpocapsae TaxID=34508 RepID=A0A4U5M898_STECR|nr:hypothetical protein L596_025620 [Steinernema carpocapsae]
MIVSKTENCLKCGQDRAYRYMYLSAYNPKKQPQFMVFENYYGYSQDILDFWLLGENTKGMQGKIVRCAQPARWAEIGQSSFREDFKQLKLTLSSDLSTVFLSNEKNAIKLELNPRPYSQAHVLVFLVQAKFDMFFCVKISGFVFVRCKKSQNY